MIKSEGMRFMSLIKGNNVVIKEGVLIGENVVLEDDVYIDYGAIIRDNVTIKKGTFVGARCILGEYLYDFFEDRKNKKHPLVIGENSLIRSETIIYGDCIIGDNFQTGHRVTIREKAKLGKNVRVGTLSDIQGRCEIGDYVSIHSNVFIGEKSIIKDYVWIFPRVILTNDPNPPSNRLRGVIIEKYASIAAGAVVLPGVNIGKEALVGAGCVVTKDVNSGKVVIGNPSKEIGDIKDIKDKETGKSVYPWQYNFDRGMPWKDIGYELWLKGEK